MQKLVCFLLAVLAMVLTGCSGKKAIQEVVVYTSLDKVYSQPILDLFEKETGIKVKAVFAMDSRFRGNDKRDRSPNRLLTVKMCCI